MVVLAEVDRDSLNVSKFLARGDPLAVLAGQLGPEFAEYRRKWELARTFKIKLPYPLHVDYELLKACNLRCPMCLSGQSPQAKESLDPEKVKSLIKEGARMGQCSMGFGGLWEPLLSPHIAELVAVGREQGLMDAMFNTNGQLLTAGLSRDLIEAGLTRLMISVDAASESTYRQMRPGGNFGLLEDNILQFLSVRQKLKKKLPVLRLSFCLTEYNFGELKTFLDTWSDKVDFFSLQEYGRFSPDLPALFPKGNLGSGPGGRCAQPQKRLLIRHNGRVLPCCDLSGLDLTVGNIKTQEIKEIWSGPEVETIRTSLAGLKAQWPESCLKCQDKYRAKDCNL
ncbi:MAG: radical SAM protein [Deltaproteobacteria bacterium]|jgi:radical SAM protein with 4Fe4S-binding SPASM domain|nr:radical SAM protein [Deltaproteobacteria bacterium]